LIANSAVPADVTGLVEQLKLSGTVCPIQLREQEASVDVLRCGSLEGTGEPVYQYVCRIPFEGDTELWALTPATAPAGGDAQPGGEIYRNHLILSVLACTRAEAQEWLTATLQCVRYVLNAQAKEIAEFNASLSMRIWMKLINARAGGHVERPFDGAPH
jgi:hypothetical protein